MSKAFAVSVQMGPASILQRRRRKTIKLAPSSIPPVKRFCTPPTSAAAFPDQTAGVAVDGQGDVYVTGTTQSPDFPVTAGALQAAGGSLGYVAIPGFVLELNPKGNQLIYSATIDGVTPAAIAVDSEGDAYVTGSSQGGLAVTTGAYWTTAPVCLEIPMVLCIPQADAFVFKLNPAGSSLTYATYLDHVIPRPRVR